MGWARVKMRDNKTFVFGVGAQKSGTTWLHDYLAGHPACDMGFAKEYHIFDALEVPHCAGFRDQVTRRLEDGDSTTAALDLKLVSFYEDTNKYFDYFAELLEQDQISVTGDVTPSYSMLSPEVMASVKAGFASRGIKTRTIFLMRDPVERIWSHVRMARRIASRDPKRQHILEKTEVEQLRESYASVQNSSRTRYDWTFGALDKVFDKSEVLIGFYEEMFSPEFVRSVTDFLDIEYVSPDFGKQLNVSAKTSDLPDMLREEIANHFADTYHDVANRFGADRIAAIWPGYCLIA